MLLMGGQHLSSLQIHAWQLNKPLRSPLACSQTIPEEGSSRGKRQGSPDTGRRAQGPASFPGVLEAVALHKAAEPDHRSPPHAATSKPHPVEQPRMGAEGAGAGSLSPAQKGQGSGTPTPSKRWGVSGGGTARSPECGSCLGGHKGTPAVCQHRPRGKGVRGAV